MQHRFAAKQTDSFPPDTGIDALAHKAIDLFQRHTLWRGCLRAGTITVEAVKVTRIGDINFDFSQGSIEFESKKSRGPARHTERAESGGKLSVPQLDEFLSQAAYQFGHLIASPSFHVTLAIGR